MKYRSLLITILFLTIGFATISTTLIINGSTSIGINQDDFNVYFSNALVNGIKDWNVIKSDREIEFSTTMKSKNETYVLDYDVTNGSKNYDAQITISCTGGNDYLSISNQFDTTTNLLARETRSGKLTITLTKQYAGDYLETEVKCTLIANGVERTELNEIEIPATIPEYYVGKEIAIANEKFNVISETDDTITLFAKQNLNNSYRQEQIENYVTFSNSTGWQFTYGPLDLDIQSYDGNAKTYVNEYVSYLQTETGDFSISGSLITLAELADLECSVDEDYRDSFPGTCKESSYADWLINGYSYWTRSAVSDDNAMAFAFVWYVSSFGDFENAFDDVNGIRPTITISKEGLEEYLKYKVGNELTIKNETFNVISSTEDTVTLLAQYNLDSTYRQSQQANRLYFSNSNGWEYTPGPLEINIQSYDGPAKTYVNEYVTFLKKEIGDDSIVGNLISLSELGKLECSYSSDYSYYDYTSEKMCEDSSYKDWLVNGQGTWTRSAASTNATYIWQFAVDGVMYPNPYDTGLGATGIRPIITISKSTYDKYYVS